MEIGLHVLSTLNGKIGFSTSPKKRIGSDQDLERIYAIRDQYEAVLIGGETVRVGVPPVWSSPNRTDYMKTVILSRKGNFDPTLPLLQMPKDKLWMCTTQVASNSMGIPTLCPNTEQFDVICQFICQKLGITRLLIEGGGQLVSQAIQSKVLNSLHLTLHTSFLMDQKAPDLLPIMGCDINHFDFKITELSYGASEIYLTLSQ